MAAGVSPAVGTRWFRECGGMPPLNLGPQSGRYLSFVEREEIAILQARGCGVREISRHGRSVRTDDQASEAILHILPQFTVRSELGNFRTLRTPIGVPLGGRGPVLEISTSCSRVPPQFSRDRRR